MPLGGRTCSVPGCIPKVSDRLTRFPVKNKELFKIWLKQLGNPQLLNLSPEHVGRTCLVCTRHFEPRWIKPCPYPGANTRAVEIGSYPTLFLTGNHVNAELQPPNSENTSGDNANLQPPKLDLPPAEEPILEHIADIIPVVPETVPEPSTSCDPPLFISSTQDDIFPVVQETVPQFSTTCDPSLLLSSSRTPIINQRTTIGSGNRTLRDSCKTRVGKLGPRLKNLNECNKLLFRKLVSRSKFVKRLRQSLQVAASSKDSARLEKALGPLDDVVKTFLFSHVRESDKVTKRRRFTYDEMVMALTLFKKLRGLYRYLDKYFAIPTVKSLETLLQKTTFSPGISTPLINHLKFVTNHMQAKKNSVCALLFDVVQLRMHLAHDVNEDIIRGFENFGRVQRPIFAEHALVFMLRGLFCKWKQPIAYMFVGNALQEADLILCIKKVLTAAFSANFQVAFTICNQKLVNINSIEVLKEQYRADCTRADRDFRPDIFTFQGREIVHIFDPPRPLSVRKSHQDSLENFFGSIRNPSCSSFITSFQTININNFMSIHSVGSNCNADKDLQLRNFENFIAQTLTLPNHPPNDNTNLELDTTTRRWNHKVTGYVARFVAKRIIRITKSTGCERCKKQLLNINNLQDLTLINVRAFTLNGLTKPNTNFMTAFDRVMKITQDILPRYCHRKGIKDRIIKCVFDRYVFSFMSCEEHDISKAFVDATVQFSINVYCRYTNRLLSGQGTRLHHIVDPVQQLAFRMRRKILRRKTHK